MIVDKNLRKYEKFQYNKEEKIDEKVELEYALIDRVISRMELEDTLFNKEVTRPIYKGNVLLLAEGAILSKPLIRLLFKNKIKEIYIKKIEINDNVTERVCEK